MKWLLLMIIMEADGQITSHILSVHETMAECHVAGTYIQFEDRLPINKDMLCFGTDIDMEVME